MANYTFGESILRYVQNQDELNLRNKQIQSEETYRKAQLGMQQRQIDLATARYNLAVEKQAETERKNFLSSHSMYDALSPEVKSQILPGMITKFEDQNYVKESDITNIEQSIKEKRLQSTEERQTQKDFETEFTPFKDVPSDIKSIMPKDVATVVRNGQHWIKKSVVDDYRAQINSNIAAVNASKTGGKKTPEEKYVENYAEAEGNLAKLKVLYENNAKLKDEAPGDYAKFKGGGEQAITEALSNVGITPETQVQLKKDEVTYNVNLLDYIKSGGNLPQTVVNEYKQKLVDVKDKSAEQAQLKREFFNKAIYSLQSILDEKQIKALKLRNEIMTR